MLQPTDLEFIQKKGISSSQVEEQLLSFKTGFPFLNIHKAADTQMGISCIYNEEQKEYIDIWNNYLASKVDICKFVPASGAASRMFKNLFEFLDAAYDEPSNDFEKKFFTELKKFAFYSDLEQVLLNKIGNDIDSLLADKSYKTIVKYLLEDVGLNYGNLPKGLLKFHTYKDHNRTPLEEHLVEGALYTTNRLKEVSIHFTVSAEHRRLFERKIEEVLPIYSNEYKVAYNISLSEQKQSTDTIAADENNEAFRDNGKLVFRPGGHGALIENLNDINADVIFIKNIDNVVPDHFKGITVSYKQLIAGVLVNLQQQTFAYLEELENDSISDAKLSIITKFCDSRLNNINTNISQLSKTDLISYLNGKLNRPIRVCGMVKNEGEPGGGPYLIVNTDGSISPQILESSQIDVANPRDKEIMMSATHFNPVDLVCGVKDYKGNKFDLTKYIDKQTGFISSKSKGGKELKALELPGLWNGAMSDWNTIFVEVPVETFNPVKTVNDLLRNEHQ